MIEDTTAETAQAAPFTPEDERDAQVMGTIDALAKERQAEANEEQGEQETPEDAAIPLNEEGMKHMLCYGVGMVELTIGAVFNVPFEIDTDSGNQWIDAAQPMMNKYAPAFLKKMADYDVELTFIMASFSLVAGSAVRVRQLRTEKLEQAKIIEAKKREQAKAQADSHPAPHETTSPMDKEPEHAVS